MPPTLSVIIPTLNEAGCIEALLSALAPARSRGVEIVVADGGSGDDTRRLAATGSDRIVAAPRGRASQLNAGAAAARGSLLLFLHADTQPPPRFDVALQHRVAGHRMAWGRFDVCIAGSRPGLGMISTLMNFRSRATGIATGDQGIFATRALFEALDGFPAQPLMEDIEFSARAKRIAAPICLRERVTTSGRRWDRNGVMLTVLRMWQLRLAYALGADPADLRRRYEDAR